MLCDNDTLNLISNIFVNNHWEKLLQLWSAAKSSFEPIIIQILNNKNNWPIPKYFGSCGCILVEEYCGTTLNYFNTADWYLRAYFALQLLIAAKNFTFDHNYFRFYLTDVSPYNIVVNIDGRITFVDLDSLLIKRRNFEYKQESIHYSITEECSDCFKYSIHSVCNHEISDHNFYAICQLLLSEDSPWPMMKNGLLHSIPILIKKKFPELKKYLKICSKSDSEINRFQAADKLISMLQNITKGSMKESSLITLMNYV